MKIKTLITKLKKDFPFNQAAKWDSVGVQTKKSWLNNSLSSIVLCLDITPEVLEHAKKNNSNLIISHHPFIFNGIQEVKNHPYKKKLFTEIKKHNISIVSLHTNFDVDKEGMNYQILKHWDCNNIQNYNKNPWIKEGTLTCELKINDLIEQLKHYFGIPIVQHNIDIEEQLLVNKLLVCAGAGGSLLKNIIPDKNMLFITGEIKWSDWLIAEQKNISVINLNHYMENKFCNFMAKYFQKETPEIPISISNIKNPIKYL